MLEKPALSDESISACLQAEYALPVSKIEFKPLGADFNSAVYRVTAADGTPYFLKLRSGIFDDITVTLPQYLSQHGLHQVIPPLPTSNGRLWADLQTFTAILYPFIAGRDGYEVALTERQWADFGAAMKKLHALQPPPALSDRLARETFTPFYRQKLKNFNQQLESITSLDWIARELIEFLKLKRPAINALVQRADAYAQVLLSQPHDHVVCHADIHAANLLIPDENTFFIVDWDNPMLAPNERDLMFIGGSQGFTGTTPKDEVTWFYQGYGAVEINHLALAYYRYERIIVDIAIYCEQLLLSSAGGADREESLGFLKSNFLPGGTIQTAEQADRTRL
jgi:spectinomycin phosphotransferase